MIQNMCRVAVGKDGMHSLCWCSLRSMTLFIADSARLPTLLGFCDNQLLRSDCREGVDNPVKGTLRLCPLRTLRCAA